MPTWPPPVYEMETEFDAPLPYVYRWCTDFSSKDGALAGETYERRILKRSKRRVIFEDLWSEPDGWRWRRYEVVLRPPRGWRADSVGNVRDAQTDYRLTALPDGRTHLFLRMRRRPGSRSTRNPAKRVLEREVEALWKHLAKNLEKDYRRSKRTARGRR